MTLFPKSEIARFLRAVDKALTEPVEMVIIGGSAATLHYGAVRATQDIDTLTNVSRGLNDAVAKAQLATGLDIPIQRVTIADEPSSIDMAWARRAPDFGNYCQAT